MTVSDARLEWTTRYGRAAVFLSMVESARLAVRVRWGALAFLLLPVGAWAVLHTFPVVVTAVSALVCAAHLAVRRVVLEVTIRNGSKLEIPMDGGLLGFADRKSVSRVGGSNRPSLAPPR